MDIGAKGKLQSNLASHIITLLTPWRKRNSQNPSRLRYGLNTEVKNASRLFGVMRDVDDFGVHTVVVVSDRNWPFVLSAARVSTASDQKLIANQSITSPT